MSVCDMLITMFDVTFHMLQSYGIYATPNVSDATHMYPSTVNVASNLRRIQLNEELAHTDSRQQLHHNVVGVTTMSAAGTHAQTYTYMQVIGLKQTT